MLDDIVLGIVSDTDTGIPASRALLMYTVNAALIIGLVQNCSTLVVAKAVPIFWMNANASSRFPSVMSSDKTDK